MTQSDLEALGAVRTVDLTTMGRRSGRPSRIEIWWHRVGGRFIITGTPGPRDWYANAVANPAVTVHVQIDGGTRDLPALARPLTEPEIRRAVFTDPETAWYAANSDLQRLIDSAPLIELTLQG